MGIISFQQRLRIYLRDKFTCVYCLKPMNPLSDELSLDHVKPDHKIRGDDNLVTCCRSCNSAKGNRTPDFFLSKMMNERELNHEESPITTTEQDIIKACIKKYDITLKDLRGKNRSKHLVKARADVIKELREFGLTLQSIGKLLRRDHTTIRHHLDNQKVTSL